MNTLKRRQKISFGENLYTLNRNCFELHLYFLTFSIELKKNVFHFYEDHITVSFQFKSSL